MPGIFGREKKICSFTGCLRLVVGITCIRNRNEAWKTLV